MKFLIVALIVLTVFAGVLVARTLIPVSKEELSEDTDENTYMDAIYGWNRSAFPLSKACEDIKDGTPAGTLVTANPLQVIRRERRDTGEEVPDGAFYHSKRTPAPKVVRLAALGTTGVVADVANQKCPLDDFKLHPCKCKNLANGITVDCERFPNRDAMVNAFIPLKGYSINEIIFHAFSTPVSNMDFDGVDFVVARFRNTDVSINAYSAEKSYTFSANPTTKNLLQSVYFTSCKINFTTTSLRDKPLRLLDVYYSEFLGDPKPWFSGAEIVQISVSGSDTIAPDFAYEVTGVEVFSYTKCNLQTWTPTTLPKDRRKLRRIDLSSNELTNIPDGLFSGMNAIEEVFLQGNKLKTLPESSIANIWGSVTLWSLEGNPFRCEAVKWMSNRDSRVSVKGQCQEEDGTVKTL